jgi:signal transduction histidine kinase/uncharacterized protein YoaH (UPF0181 family)
MGPPELETETQQRSAWLAEEQAALRRVATHVARGVPHEMLLRATVDEVRQLLDVDLAAVSRYHLPDRVVVLYRSGEGASDEVFDMPLGGENVATLVARTLQPARMDDYSGASGPLADWARREGFSSLVAAPIVVDGNLWGVMTVGSRTDAALPERTEERLGSFTELLAVAIANVESREQLSGLLEEQAALRRLATLVAAGASSDEILAATADEVRHVMRVDVAAIARYVSADRILTLQWSSDVKFGARQGEVFPLGGTNVATLVAETRQPARIDTYADASGPVGERMKASGFASAVGVPVIVDARLWGVVIVGTGSEDRLAADTEPRLMAFTELLATAIANVESLDRLTRLLDEQSALRRLATLIVTGAAEYELLAATADEVREVMRCDVAALSRYLPGDRILTVHWSGEIDFPSRDGDIHPLGGQNVTTLVARSGKPARIDSYADATGDIGRDVQASVLGSTVGVPVLVDGRLWGLIIAGVTSEKPPLPDDAETRLERFTELLATGIANAEGRAALTASRARVVAASDETRRRIERDLHDGVQQRILSLLLEVQEAQAQIPTRPLDDVVDGLNEIQDQLREITSGLHPAMLAEGGIASALGTLTRRAPLPVYLDISLAGEPSEPVEVAVYFIVSELITNAAKHAQASRMQIALEASDGVLRLAVEDDGVGGADPGRGSGLLGLSDRVAAMSGAIELKSPPGEGTAIWVELPLEWDASNVST